MRGEIVHTAAEGNGPVGALDAALRKALVGAYPEIAGIRLEDYKVRILDSVAGTAAIVRVMIDTAFGEERWSTVGASSERPRSVVAGPRRRDRVRAGPGARDERGASGGKRCGLDEEGEHRPAPR